MPVMELSEVHEEKSEEKICMLRDKLDSLRWKMEGHLRGKNAEVVFMQLLKKVAGFDKTEDALRFLVDSLAKFEMKRIDDMSEEKEDGSMSFINLVIAGNGSPEPTEETEM